MEEKDLHLSPPPPGYKIERRLSRLSLNSSLKSNLRNVWIIFVRFDKKF